GFVVKLNAAGSAVVYSTYLGGNDTDTVTGIAIDKNGAAYITGGTVSKDFPTTAGAAQRTRAGGGFGDRPGGVTCEDAFVSKLDATGSALVYSTYLGGSDADVANGIAVDASGSSYVTGQTLSLDFPTSPGAFQPAKVAQNWDFFVAKLD